LTSGIVKLATKSLEGLPGHFGRDLGVDLHRDADPAVPQDLHGDARMHVERGQK